MTFMRKIVGVINSNLNNIFDKMEEPDKIIELQLEKVENQISSIHDSVVEAIANRNMLQKKYDKNKKKCEEYDQKIEIALSQNKEELAREIAAEQNILNSVQLDLKNTLDEQNVECEKLKKLLVTLEKKQNELKNQKYVLTTKYQIAKARNKVQDTLSKVSIDSPIKEINRMNDKIEKLEAKASAKKEINDGYISQKIANLDIGMEEEKINQKIEEIRKKMNENPISNLLKNPDIVDIIISSYNQIYIRNKDEKDTKIIPISFKNEEHLINYIKSIFKDCDYKNSLEISKDNIRYKAMLEPTPTLTIRKYM